MRLAIAMLALLAATPTTAQTLQLRTKPDIGARQTTAVGSAVWEQYQFEGAPGVIIDTALQALGITEARRSSRWLLAGQLAELEPITGEGKYLFPSIRSSERPITDNTFNAALRRLGFGKDEVTAHGFWATASTLLNEMGKWHPDAIERQLANVEPNDVRRAYARGAHWDERVKMMRHWSKYLECLQTGAKILKGNFRRA